MKRYPKTTVRARDRAGTKVNITSPVCKVCGKSGVLRNSGGKMVLVHDCEPRVTEPLGAGEFIGTDGRRHSL